MLVAILKNELDISSQWWEIACKNAKVEYVVVDLMKDCWAEDIIASKPDLCLACPSGLKAQLKTMYDEKIYWIENNFKIKVYPSFNEIYVYENKRCFAYFAKTLGIPIPETNIFYDRGDALRFIDNISYPIVAKTTIGAAGTGVKVLKSRNAAELYIKKAFTTGIKRKSGPNLMLNSKTTLLKKIINDPAFALKKLKSYKNLNSEVQVGFVIFQEFVPHDYEWRIVKVGESYFGHKKIKIGEMASGTKKKSYDTPNTELLDFVDDICSKAGFNIVAVDVLVNHKGEYYINEMQTKWGQKFDYLMIKDNMKGRYIKKNNDWIFEEGDFCQNKSFNLKLQWIIEQNFKHEK